MTMSRRAHGRLCRALEAAAWVHVDGGLDAGRSRRGDSGTGERVSASCDRLRADERGFVGMLDDAFEWTMERTVRLRRGRGPRDRRERGGGTGRRREPGRARASRHARTEVDRKYDGVFS